MRLILLGISSFVFLGSLALADTCDSSGNLVNNCGFETGTLASWQVTGAQSSPAFQNVTYGVDTSDAFSGQYGAFIGGYGAAVSLQQSFATTLGTSYTISYELAQSPATPSPYTNNFATLFNGATLSSLASAPMFGFTQYTLTATATGPTATLTFSAQDDTGFYSLDDISVTAVSTPEPVPGKLVGSLLVLAIALRGIGGTKNRLCRH